MHEVHVSARSIEPFTELVGKARVRSVERLAAEIRGNLHERAVWNINSTEAGGGVAEMLRSFVRYTRGLGIDVRWLVLDGTPEFFRITKRLHNALHGSCGDGSPLGPEQAVVYEAVLRENFAVLDTLVRPGDVVICHDPQTAGLVPHLLRRGALTSWRCHIGHEIHDEEVQRGWEFLRPYIAEVPVAIFTRLAYAPSWLAGRRRAFVLPPNIDPFSAKNQAMSVASVRAILTHVGLIDGPKDEEHNQFRHDDGSIGRVDRAADVLQCGPPPSWDTPMVVQVSRWDAMKDPAGVMRGFVGLLANDPPCAAALVLAGPSLGSVADDPEGPLVLSALEAEWRALPCSMRRPVTIALLPMDDAEENAAMVNALQRHAAVIVQKSLHEGFGLTVTEAMWKARAVVASAVGGIQDQIRDGVDGLLLRDPRDPCELAASLRRVLSDPLLARRLAESGRDRVRENYLTITALERWGELVQQMLAAQLAAGTSAMTADAVT